MAIPKGKMSKELEDQIFDWLVFGSDFGRFESNFYLHVRRSSDAELESEANPTTNNVDPEDLRGAKTITLGKDSYRPTRAKLPEK